MAALVLLLSSSSSNAQNLTQLGFVKALAGFSGATADIGDSDADFLQWAKDIGLSIDDPNGVISAAKLAEHIVKLKGLNPKKYGGDFVRQLLREGIDIPEVVTRESLAEVFADLPDVVPNIPSASPVRRGRTGNVPPGFLNPRNPHYGTPVDQLPGAQGIANAQNRGNRR